ncbi:translocation/assembly module TamB domain-containing protein [Flavobacterium agricola]|uniref:Translocation/assembly module TamB domain-containing protein n=1 Tax=Flavobacterium agricola TaxID=2870839 RepID=A0ABY6M0G4_9FLAO|nr:translocation/assembly module TamB [Flavobacterium agricola]UYW02047.1 translocation/assembly module TamB domain-containing protein [Flavobacterium agricola]
MYVNKLKTSLLGVKEIANSKVFLGKAELHNFNFKVIKYENEDYTNLDEFISKVDDGQPGTGRFRLSSPNIKAYNSRFQFINKQVEKSKILDFNQLNGDLDNFYIKGPEITTNIKQLSFNEQSGISVKQLAGNFLYNKTNLYVKELNLKTAESTIEGKVELIYKPKYFQDFTNKVRIETNITRSRISSNDLNTFYNEFAPNQYFYLQSQIQGFLNDFTLFNLSAFHTSGTEVIGKVQFQNLFDKEKEFRMIGRFAKAETSYQKTNLILPRILHDKLPEALNRLGNVVLVGQIDLSKRDLSSNMSILTSIGKGEAFVSLEGFDNPDKVKYLGKVALNDFDLGYFLNEDILQKTTFNIKVDGTGFTKKAMNVGVNGKVNKFYFGGYNYTNIEIDGNFKQPYFNGNLKANDPNLKMIFNGLVNLEENHKEFDFKAQVDLANLHLLGIRKNKEIATFSGSFDVKASGNTIDDIAGTAIIDNIVIDIDDEEYQFKDFLIQSTFTDQVRHLTFQSPDIVSGNIVGIYQANQVGKLVQNALGSLYSNYSPFELNKKQFIDFDVTIYNKIVEVLDEKISVSNKTTLKGRIDGDSNDFSMNFKSPNLVIYNNELDNVNIQVNNKNPLFNTFIEMDSIKMPKYKLSNFSLINLTLNDTMYVRSEFAGGAKATDLYNLNLYHTIDTDNKSVLGFKKSEIAMKNFTWFINEEDSPEDNKIIFNKKLDDFEIDNISMSSAGQRVNLYGTMQGKYDKDLSLTFDDVDLSKLLIINSETLSFGGELDGVLNVKQNKPQQYQPSTNLIIEKFKFNGTELGNFTFNINGNDDFSVFTVNSKIKEQETEKLAIDGTIDFKADPKGKLDLEMSLSNFKMQPLQQVLGNIFQNIRGFASGKTAVEGVLLDPEINGRVYLTDAGMTIPFLGVDFNMEQNASIDVTENQFLIRHIKLTDTKYNTSAYIDGSIRHKHLQNWFLDVDVNSKNMLILDTKDNYETPFYGTAFIEGTAHISGPTNALVFDIKAKSNTGTTIKLPLGESEGGLGNNSFVHFYNQKDKKNIEKGITAVATSNNIEMIFDLDITPEAEIEIILDRSSGHGMKGRGIGTINIELNTLGKFRMLGDYQVWSGEYNFRYGGIIDKKFQVNKYSTIRWADGNPMNALLNLQAVYKTESNPAILLENPSFNRKIPTDVIIDLSGNLTNPHPDFIISFPNLSSVMKSEIDYKLQDKDTRQTQAMALLTGGGFLTQENAANAVYGSIFERAGSLFSEIFSGDEEVLQVGFNYTQADRNPYIQTEGRIGVTLSTNINEKIMVNGKVRVPVGGTEESTIIGDIEVAIKLNTDGSLTARVFNRENDIYYFGEGIGYTQGVGVNYQVDFDTFRELLGKIIKSANKKTKETPVQDSTDSDFSPEFIKFIESRKNRPNLPEPQKTTEPPMRVPDLD